MGLPPVRYTPEVNLGAILQICAVGAAAIGVYASFAGSVHDGEVARAKYIPIIEDLRQSDKLQDERILNLSSAHIDTRRAIDSINDRLTEIAVQLTDIRARLLPASQRQGVAQP